MSLNHTLFVSPVCILCLIDLVVISIPRQDKGGTVREIKKKFPMAGGEEITGTGEPDGTRE